jgi:hypothetical protein
MKTINAKYGFGMSNISKEMSRRYTCSTKSLLDFIEGKSQKCNPSHVSEVKGMFNRCLRRDQWDWFAVFQRLGSPTRKELHAIPVLLADLRKHLCNGTDFSCTVKKLLNQRIKSHLSLFLNNGREKVQGGWIYILSTREEPGILKIGRTNRPVDKRVKEINAATGVAFPYSVLAAFNVADSTKAEFDIHELLKEYRIRKDREFFNVDFSFAARVVDNYVHSIDTPMRRER